MSWGIFPLFFTTFGLGVERIGILKAVYPVTWGILQVVTMAPVKQLMLVSRTLAIIANSAIMNSIRRMQVTGTERYDTAPDKNRFSHPHDALQYLLLGGGECRQLIRGATPARPVVAAREWDVFARRPDFRNLKR